MWVSFFFLNFGVHTWQHSGLNPDSVLWEFQAVLQVPPICGAGSKLRMLACNLLAKLSLHLENKTYNTGKRDILWYLYIAIGRKGQPKWNKGVGEHHGR